MGRPFDWIFAFLDFSVFRRDLGLLSSGIVLDTRVVFLNVTIIVWDANYAPIIAI